jgi:hypothetical protein
MYSFHCIVDIKLDELQFTSHNVELPVKKTLKQRDTRVPPMQVRSAMMSNSSDTQRGRTREPVQDLRHIVRVPLTSYATIKTFVD